MTGADEAGPFQRNRSKAMSGAEVLRRVRVGRSKLARAARKAASVFSLPTLGP